jgi:hypothetical protein
MQTTKSWDRPYKNGRPETEMNEALKTKNSRRAIGHKIYLGCLDLFLFSAVNAGFRPFL